MAQPHQLQMPVPSPAFSPPQMSPSIPPTPAQAAYAAANHPSKRQKMSPGPGLPHSQPVAPSPYLQTASFANSPAAATTPTPTPPASGSVVSPPPYGNHIPQYSTTLAPQPRATTVTSPSGLPLYLNGNVTAAQNGVAGNTGAVQMTGLTMPSPRHPGTPPVISPALPGPPPPPTPAVTTPLATPITPMPAPSPYMTTTATLAPIPTTPAPGAMGPPSKPADRTEKDVQYDWDDTLAGTGINLKEEEQNLSSYHAGTSRPEARTGFPINAPGGSGSFFGAGVLNQPALHSSLDQAQYTAELAKGQWVAAAHNLATVRSNEIRNPFASLTALHYRFQKIAAEHGMGLVLDSKGSMPVGKMRVDYEFTKPEVTVKYEDTGPGGAKIVSTCSSFIPNDSFLAEQIALLSIATKHRIRQLLEDSSRLALHRQQTSHGEVPAEWAEVAVPLQTLDASLLNQDNPSSGPGNESAVSPHTNPLKRPLGTGVTAPLSASANPGVSLTAALREGSKSERDAEELRMRKRQKRAEDEERRKKGEGVGADSVTPSRSGSVAPGTPGGGSTTSDQPGSAAAPQQPKAPTKKELKAKANAASRTSEAQATANSNQTMNLMFTMGKKKKGKQYSWLTAGSSGASTPQRMGGGAVAPGTPGAGPLTPAGATAAFAGAASRAPVPVSLTIDGRYRFGEFRESGEKGKNIQLRDWVGVLETDGRDVKALQKAYDKLDSSK